MKAFVLIVTFAAAGNASESHTARIANFDDYESCVAAGRSLYSQQRWQCLPPGKVPLEGAGR
jgi:hypothetical protein